MRQPRSRILRHSLIAEPKPPIEPASSVNHSRQITKKTRMYVQLRARQAGGKRRGWPCGPTRAIDHTAALKTPQFRLASRAKRARQRLPRRQAHQAGPARRCYHLAQSSQPCFRGCGCCMHTAHKRYWLQDHQMTTSTPRFRTTGADGTTRDERRAIETPSPNTAVRLHRLENTLQALSPLTERPSSQPFDDKKAQRRDTGVLFRVKGRGPRCSPARRALPPSLALACAGASSARAPPPAAPASPSRASLAPGDARGGPCRPSPARTRRTPREPTPSPAPSASPAASGTPRRRSNPPPAAPGNPRHCRRRRRRRRGHHSLFWRCCSAVFEMVACWLRLRRPSSGSGRSRTGWSTRSRGSPRGCP